jgi:integrase
MAKTRYGDYCEMRDGELYAAVNIPTGNGRYKKKRKKVDSKTEARQWALGELEKAKLGETSARSGTFSELSKWYTEEFLHAPEYKAGARLQGLRTYKHQQVMLTRLGDYFGDYPLGKLSVDVLRRYKRERLKHVGIATTNREFALMRTMFKKAKFRGWVKESPFEQGENLIEVSLETHRESPITTRIAKRLLARSRKSEQPLLHYLILVLMHTGARPSEVFPFKATEDVKSEPLIWGNVTDFDFRAVRLVSYKGRIRREKLVPASVELETGLKRLYVRTKPQPGDLVFPVKSFKRSWKTLCRSVGVEGVWMRDFRKYFNSRIMLMPEINDMERMLMLGHSDITTNRRYSKLDEDFVEKFRKATSIQESDSVN